MLYLTAVYGDNGAIIGVELLNFGLYLLGDDGVAVLHRERHGCVEHDITVRNAPDDAEIVNGDGGVQCGDERLHFAVQRIGAGIADDNGSR